MHEKDCLECVVIVIFVNKNDNTINNISHHVVCLARFVVCLLLVVGCWMSLVVMVILVVVLSTVIVKVAMFVAIWFLSDCSGLVIVRLLSLLP